MFWGYIKNMKKWETSVIKDDGTMVSMAIRIADVDGSLNKILYGDL